MKKFILGLVFICAISLDVFGQNDDCDMPTQIFQLDGSCNGYDNVGATFDLANGDCAPAPNAPNIWFTFVANGPDLTIDVNGEGNNVYVTLLEFDPNPCEFASAGQLACGFGDGLTEIINVNSLVTGNTYYLIVNLADLGGNAAEGFFQMCIDNPSLVPPPPNDEGCNAEVINPNGVCNNGTTLNATQEYTSIPNCSIVPVDGVFYEFTISPGNLFVTIDLNDISLGGDVAVVLGQWDPNCNGNLVIDEVYCGPPGTGIIQFPGVVAGETYVVFVATEAAASGDFQLCVTESGPPPGCSVNNTCAQAENIPGVSSANTSYTCVPGCNILASSEPNLPGCNFATQEVVWFSVNTDASTSLMSATVSSETIEAPSIQFFSGSCNGLVQQSVCNTGTGGEVSIVNEDVAANSTIYIAVSNSFGEGGEFELCVLILDDPSACTVETGLEVVATSLGSPFDGPFQPDETVSFCYTIDEYTAVGNNCQWLQGIIPIFGNGWSPSSFNAVGMPISNSGVQQPGGYPATWGWYTDVTYNTTLPGPNASKSIGDFDGDGDIEMCHFSEPDCPGTGITAGQIVPPGWFCWSPNGGAGGHPNVDWGDGQGCGPGQGPWQVCFDLITLSFDECDGDPQITDTSVKIYTTADGETGDWTGGISICADDIPTTLNTVINCCIGPVVDDLNDVVCPGGTTDIVLSSDQMGNSTYSWTVEPNGNVSGYADGSGQFITQTLENNTNFPQIVNYIVTATSEEGCLGFPTTIPVTVLPAIQVDAGDPIDGCAQGEFTLGGSPTANGGDGSFSYDWGNAAVANVANPTASPNISTIYTVTVTDGNGCTSTDEVELTINPRFEVEVTGELQLCPDSPESSFSGAPLGGSPNYSFDWNGTGIVGGSSQNTDFNGYGLPSGDYTITLTVTDNNGCTGDEEFTVDIFNDPQIFIASIPDGGQFCPGESIDISAAAILGEPGVTYNYNWTTPSGGTKNGTNIVADETGWYVLEVVDPIIFCSKFDSIFIEEIQPPEPEIIAPVGICPGEMVYIKTDTEYDTYEWGSGATSDSILVGPGTYFVTVTNSAGCEGIDVVTVNPFPPVSASIGGSSAFCEGSSSTLNVSSSFQSFEWTDDLGNIISTADTALVTEAGTYSVLVVDVNGCVGTDNIDVVIQDFLVPNVSGDTSICPQACTDLNAGAGYASYEWSTNETTQIITVCDPGNYSVTVYDAGGCTGEQVKTITVNDLPIPQILGENNKTSICPGEDLMLDAGSGYTAYLWDDNTMNQSITVSSAGTYFVTVTDSEGCQASAEITVVENSVPNPSFTGDTQFCPGDSVQITPEAGYDMYMIDVDNNGSIDITNTTNEPFYVSVVGNSNIIVLDNNGCEGEVLVNVSQFVPPSPQTAIDTASFCTNGSVFISTTQDFVSVDWYTNNSLVGTGQSIEVSTAGTYDVIVTDLNGCTGITSMEVIESTQLFPAITGETAMCDNTPIDLNAGNGYDDYDWGVNGNTQIITVSTAGIYQVTVSDAGGCSGTAQVVVTNSNTPMASVPEDLFICNNKNGDNESTVSFNGLVTGAQGFWSDVDGSGVSLGDLNNVDFDGIAPGFYTFEYTTSIAIQPCVNQTYSLTVEVNECLCPSLELGSPMPLCIGDPTINLEDYKVTSETGTWNVESGNGAALTGSIFNPANASAGTYVISFNLDQAKENCDSVRTLELEVIAPPNAGVFSEPRRICLGDNETVSLEELLEGEDLGGVWTETSTNTSTGAAFNSTNGSFTTTSQIVGTYTFQYLVPGAGPCGDDLSQVEVVIEELPTAVAGEDKMLNCDLPKVTIGTDQSTGNGLVYKWTEDKGTPVGNSTSPIIEVDEEGLYYLEVTDMNACVDRDTAIVTRNTDFPDVTLEGNDPFCAGENTGNVVATAFDGEGPYQYSIDNGTNWLDNNAFLNLPAGTYNVLVQDQNSCTGEEVITIQDPSPFTADLGGNLLLQNVEDTLINLFVSSGLNNLQAAIWTINDSIVCSGPECIAYNIILDTDKTVCVTAINTNGCEATDCITIRSIDINEVYTGNAFSPNDDGINDIFYIQGGKNVVNVNYFRIFNRWGEEVFAAEDFPPGDPSYGWNGTFKNSGINAGVFVYVAEIEFENGEIRVINGDVTILK